MKNQTLNDSTLLFFSIIMLAVVFALFTSGKYGASNRQVVDKLQDNVFISYESLYTWHSSDSKERDQLVVDLRPPEEYREGHLAGAVNIPFADLLDRSHRRTLKTNSPVWLYAGHEHVSVAALTLLLGQGFENVQVIPGNFQAIKQHVVESFDPSRAFYRDDKARWDHQRFMPLGITKEPDRKPSPAIPAPPEETPVPGGC